MNPNIREGSPEWDLVKTAVEIAAYCPLEIRTPQTLVGTVDLVRLRGNLDALGIDWRKVKEARG